MPSEPIKAQDRVRLSEQEREATLVLSEALTAPFIGVSGQTYPPLVPTPETQEDVFQLQAVLAAAVRRLKGRGFMQPDPAKPAPTMVPQISPVEAATLIATVFKNLSPDVKNRVTVGDAETITNHIVDALKKHGFAAKPIKFDNLEE